MLKPLIQKLMAKQDLSSEDMHIALELMLTEQNAAQTAAFLSLLAAKRETVEEIVGLTQAMQAKMIRVSCGSAVMDIVGTGGDGSNSVNISTGSALLAASCGVTVAKHGNRAVSSQSGSADVLAALSYPISLKPDIILAGIHQFHFGFFYAPLFHPVLQTLRATRKSLAVPTILNLVGPLLNPANADFLMVGVAKLAHLDLLADSLMALGCQRAFVFHGHGMDEMTSTGHIQMREINRGVKKKLIVDPRDYGFKTCTIADLQGGSPSKNAAMLKACLQGETGHLADTLILNAGFANYLYGKSPSIDAGIDLAKEVHARGEAFRNFTQLIHFIEKTNSEVSHA